MHETQRHNNDLASCLFSLLPFVVLLHPCGVEHSRKSGNSRHIMTVHVDVGNWKVENMFLAGT